MDNTDVITSALCQESAGAVVRSVRRMPLSASNLQRFWQESRKFKTLFSKEIRDDFHSFLEVFLIGDHDGIPYTTNGLFWVIDDFVGMFYMTDIRPACDAQLHYSFFDCKHVGRKDLVLKMLRYVFDHYEFRRLSTEVPLYAVKHTFNFVESLGFVKEGRKRKATMYEGEWFDVNCYGILREEIENGNKN